MDPLVPSLRNFLPPKPLHGFVKTNGDPSSHPVYIPVESSTCQVVHNETGKQLAEGLYAIGPLQGDNFVRYVVGNAYAVVRHLTSDGVLGKKVHRNNEL